MLQRLYESHEAARASRLRGRAAAAPAAGCGSPAQLATHRPGCAGHELQLTSAYGTVLRQEYVADEELAAALHRFHERAMSRPNCIVVLDGVPHTRNSFIELVRQFDACAGRQRRLHGCRGAG